MLAHGGAEVLGDPLQGAIAGDVLLPGSPEYELARKPPIARFREVRPRAVVRCATPSDVAATISMASGAGLRIAPRSGGHCFAGSSSTTGIVVDITPMRSVSVEGGVVTVGAGARLGDLYDALAAHDLTIPAGCGPPSGSPGSPSAAGWGSSAAATG